MLTDRCGVIILLRHVPLRYVRVTTVKTRLNRTYAENMKFYSLIHGNLTSVWHNCQLQTDYVSRDVKIMNMNLKSRVLSVHRILCDFVVLLDQFDGCHTVTWQQTIIWNDSREAINCNSFSGLQNCGLYLYNVSSVTIDSSDVFNRCCVVQIDILDWQLRQID